MSENKVALFKKLLKIQQEVLGLSKDKKSFSYDYVTGSKVLGFIKPRMNELGLLLKQEVLDIRNERQDYTNAKGQPKSEVLTTLRMMFTWVDVETGEIDTNMFAANGMNEWEKGAGSALTYAERYFLLKYFHIPTDEDDIDNPDRKPIEPKSVPSKVEEPKKAASKAQPKKEEVKAPEEDWKIKAKASLKKLDVAAVIRYIVKDLGITKDIDGYVDSATKEEVYALYNKFHIPETK